MASAAHAGRLLLVDDDHALLSALRFAFEVDGYDVAAWGSGEELLAQPLPVEHACLVIDQRLPGLSGVETIQLLRQRGCRAPVILMTSYPTEIVVREARRGSFEIVEKPLLGDALASRVQAALAG